MTSPICTILIPAYNEEHVIKETLISILLDAQIGEFDILLICNGCKDQTSEIAKNIAQQSGQKIRIFSIPIASKTLALNYGIAKAKCDNIVFMDADIKASANSIRSLIHRLHWSGALLTYGNAKFITNQSNLLVKAFYKAWMQNPYFDNHKMGGFFAINRKGLDLLGELPNTINDDEYIRRKLMHNCSYSDASPYAIMAPQTLASLIRVRSRVYRGNKELEKNETRIKLAFGKEKISSNAKTFIKRLVLKPKLWFGASVFMFTAIAAHIRNYLLDNNRGWEKDWTSRRPQ